MIKSYVMHNKSVSNNMMDIADETKVEDKEIWG